MGGSISFEHKSPTYGGYHQDSGRAKYYGAMGGVGAVIALVIGLIAREVNIFVAMVAIGAIYMLMKAVIHYNEMEITRARMGLMFLFMSIVCIVFSFLANSDVLMFIGFGGVGYLVINELVSRKLQKRIGEGEHMTLGQSMLAEAQAVTGQTRRIGGVLMVFDKDRNKWMAVEEIDLSKYQTGFRESVPRHSWPPKYPTDF